MNNIIAVIVLVIIIFIIYKNQKDYHFIIPVLIIVYFTDIIIFVFTGETSVSVCEFGNLNVKLQDIAVIIMLAQLIIDKIGKKNMNSYSLIDLFLFLMSIELMWALLSGLISYGLTSVVVGDIRTMVSFLVAIIYCYNYFRIEDSKRYLRKIDLCMNVLLILSVILWVLDIGAGIHVLRSQIAGLASDGGSTMRFIQSSDVLVIAFYTLFLIWKDVETHSRLTLRPCCFACMIILFQHRTVWAAFIGGLSIILINIFIKKKTTFAEKKMVFKFISAICFFVVFATMVLIFGNGHIMDNIRHAFELLFNTTGQVSSGTFNTRIIIWNAIYESLVGIHAWFGFPFGTGYATNIGWATSPHSGYMRWLATTGYIGLIIFISLLIYAIYKCLNQKLILLVALLISILFFMYGYDFTLYIGCTLGSILNIVSRPKKDKAN